MTNKRKLDEPIEAKIDTPQLDIKDDINLDKCEDKANKNVEVNNNDTNIEEKSDDIINNKIDTLEDDNDSTYSSSDGTDNSSDDQSSEYNSTDSSDEEDNKYTIGNIPMKWYEDLQHAGYDLDGQKISKPLKSDELDKLVNKISNPDFWKTIQDPLSGKKQVLTDAELSFISSLRRSSTVKTKTSMDPHEDAIDFFTYKKMQTSLIATDPSKASFIPSLFDKKKVGHLVHLIKTGKMKLENDKKTKIPKPERTFHSIWDDDEIDQHKTFNQLARLKMHVPAPKAALPGHSESYRPPPEFILDEEEQKIWEENDEKKIFENFLPAEYESLRHVKGYGKFINERFERCLDLYLCPRQRKMKMNVDPESLIPKLPKPQDLQPFPMVEGLKYIGHESDVTSISVSISGQFLASGDKSGIVKVYEVISGRCLRTFNFEDSITGIEFYPTFDMKQLLAVSEGKNVHMVNTGVGNKIMIKKTDVFFNNIKSQEDQVNYIWEKVESDVNDGKRVKIKHNYKVKTVQWHSSGTYFISLLECNTKQQVIIHRLAEQKSMCPFKSSDGQVQAITFHPSRPQLYIARQNAIKIYDLQKQQLLKTLNPAGQNISSISIHPATGDHVLVTSLENRSSWIDMDLSTKPYKTFPHDICARKGNFHPNKYNLFSISLDDGSTAIWHCRVFSDLTQNPQLVPVRVLKAFRPKESGRIQALDNVWHPTQPWIFVAFSDNSIRLFS